MVTGRQWGVLGVSLTSVALAALPLFGLRFNPTASMPKGFYWLTRTSAARGSAVMICPPALPVFSEALRRGYLWPGDCPAGSAPFLKVAAALQGDEVAVVEEGVLVNGKMWRDSKPYLTDDQGRAMPSLVGFSQRLDKGQVLLLSHSATAFDGRYFGPIDLAGLQGVVRSVWTW